MNHAVMKLVKKIELSHQTDNPLLNELYGTTAIHLQRVLMMYGNNNWNAVKDLSPAKEAIDSINKEGTSLLQNESDLGSEDLEGLLITKGINYNNCFVDIINYELSAKKLTIILHLETEDITFLEKFADTYLVARGDQSDSIKHGNSIRDLVTIKLSSDIYISEYKAIR